MKFDEKAQVLLEQLSIKYVKREYYPRNFQLSEDFVRAFRRELQRLTEKERLPKKAAFKKLCKSLIFHI